MNIVDGRGQNKVEQAKKNRELVRVFFEENDGSTIIECQRKLGFSYMTVRGHLDEILKG